MKRSGKLRVWGKKFQNDHDSAHHSDQHEGVEDVAYRYDRPLLFYGLVTASTWACWLLAALIDRLPEQTLTVQGATAALSLAGLFAPLGVVGWLVRRRPDLQADIHQRLLWWRRGASPLFLGLAVLLPLGSLLLAQAVSLLFGYSAEQFRWRGGLSFTTGLIPAWLTPTLAPILEELAWHSYGTDTLLTRLRLFTASLLFTVFWALWHLPLVFIQGNYQSEVVQEGWLHALNFPLSMVSFVLLLNWLYYRAGRSILVAVLFHLCANLFNEVFQTHPDTKLIQTALLTLVAAGAVWHDRRLFFALPPKRR